MGRTIHIARGGVDALAGAGGNPGIARPPRRGAPPPVYPITVDRQQKALAPVPLVDRYPLVIGQGLSAGYLASVYRLATTGYRQQYVDLQNELLEQDAHLFSVVQKRILSTANGAIEIQPPYLPKGHKDAEQARKIADDVQARIDRIANRTESIAALLWAVYYGLAGAENFWTHNKFGWSVDRLGFIHSRRLAYPDGQSWDLYVWDQGQVLGWDSPWGNSPTNSNLYGLRVGDFPGKFTIHAPQLRGDYPTRDGVARETGIWAIFKRIGARGASTYLERFAKSFMDVVYNQPASGGDGGTAAHAREADDPDIELAKQIAQEIGPGSASYAVHGSSITINPKAFDGGSSSKLTWQEWIGLCDAQESKAVLGGTLGTEVGKGGGNRALGEVQERGEVDIEQYDATVLAQTLRRDIVSHLVRLNFPGHEHLTPKVIVHVDTDPDPKTVIANAKAMAEIGAPVDLDDLAETVGIPLVPNEDKGPDGKVKPRRAYIPDVTPPAEVDPDLESEESKQAKQDQADADNAVAMQKAKQPPVMPGAAGPGAKTAPKGGKAAPAKGTKPTAKPTKLRDEADETDAAIAIVRDEAGRILAVSRPENGHELAIPGGHVEPGETLAEAAVRELAEETGIRVEELHHILVLTSPVDGRRVHVFAVDAWSGTAEALEEGTRVDWLAAEDLYHQALFFRRSIRELRAAGVFDTDPPAALAAS